MKYLLYILFIYFGSRGILENYNLIPDLIDLLLNLILKGTFIVWLINFIFTNKSEILFQKYIVALFGVFLISSLINFSSIEKVLKFAINVFYPISVFYFIIYSLSNKEILKIFNFTIIYVIIQILFSFIVNVDIFLTGSIIADDPFNGFFGLPRAYQFSFLAAIISLFCVMQIIKKKRKIWYLLFALFSSVQILAGAGRIFLVYILILLIGTFMIFKLKARNIILMGLVILILIPIISYYKSKMKNFEDGVAVLQEEKLIDNPKIFYFLESLEPLLKDKIALIVGFGPGNYMSWTGIAFNPDLERKYNSDIHGEYSTDAYQAFNNIIGFWGEIGFLGLLAYYSFLISIIFKFYQFRKYNMANYMLIVMIVLFGIIQSTLVQVFDDAYYSLSFWFYLAISIRFMIYNQSYLSSKLKNKSTIVHGNSLVLK